MSGQALATVSAPAPALPMVTREQLDLVKRTIANGATDDELRLFFYDCQRNGVHPLDKLIHFTKRGGRYTPITSIDLMRIRAHDTGECAGIDDAAYDPAEETSAPPQVARVTVYRMIGGQRCPFTATARWAEYYPGDQQGHMWRKMPRVMLGKCAEALALRKAFPKQLHGLYAREEMAQAEADEPTTRKTTAKRAPDAEIVETSPPSEEAQTVTHPVAPSYEPFGAVQMASRMFGSVDKLPEYFGPERLTKTALDKLKAENQEAFRAGYDKLHAEYVAWKDQNA